MHSLYDDKADWNERAQQHSQQQEEEGEVGAGRSVAPLPGGMQVDGE